ncbi:hypothetical protein Sme01_27470 [Sphaerisporangium melleum]|uniref:YoaR-like putative peptidoglycan binding domain-containing protein n=1 Tax=Sphaerisporangium melleum TaxID=321316 RepID=A0A917QW26_9ACTN|nr:VanW family protein [Sphaerisporangium melleum]GGK70612.1 hypothetical protein GCM10007964_11880 [Sphaerisporangium melleum]GII70271.1 hypothetical protein Sme01_27470 [Sphaerisporangium melleum]
MRNAGASIDPPPDPFAAVRPDSPVALPVDRQYSKDSGDRRGQAPGERKKLPRGVSPLPPGVSPEIFATTPPPFAATPPPPGTPPKPPVTLPPPPAGPAEPWPVKGNPRARRPVGEQKPASGHQNLDDEAESPALRRRLRGPLLAAGALGLLLVIAYLVPAALMWGKVPPGTHVRDLPIGGLSATQAIERLHERYDGKDQQAVGLLLDGRRVAVLDPREAGLTIDIEATVGDVDTGFPSPMSVWQSFTGERQLPLRVSINQRKLNDRVRRIAREIDRPVREGAIVYKSATPQVLTPQEGLRLDQAKTADAIKRAFVDAPASVVLPVGEVRPKVAAATFDGALVTARRAVADPITLVNGGRRVTLSPKVIAAHLTFTADHRGQVRPVFDARKAVAGLEVRLVGVAEAVREAGFVIDGETPRLVHARVGKGVDTARLAEAVARVIAGGGHRTIPVSLAVTKPTLTDAAAMRLGIREKVASAATSYTCCAARVTNIRKAAALVDGKVVRPGETFSLNEAIGDPAAQKFVRAQAIEGDRLVIAVGGGLSQFATTLYNAAFLAGMQEVDRTPYPFHVSGYPEGRDASVSYPDHDLRWRNDTDHGVLIKASATGTSVTVSLWSTRTYDRIEAETTVRSNPTEPETRTDTDPSCIPMNGTPGFTVTVTRVFRKDGKTVKKDKPQTTVYDPAPKVICRPARSTGPFQQDGDNAGTQLPPPGQDDDPSANGRKGDGRPDPGTPVTPKSDNGDKNRDNRDDNGNDPQSSSPHRNADPTPTATPSGGDEAPNGTNGTNGGGKKSGDDLNSNDPA